MVLQRRNKNLFLAIAVVAFAAVFFVVFFSMKYKKQSKDIGCITKLYIDLPTTPRPSLLVIYVLVRDTVLQEVLRNNNVKEIHSKGQIFERLDAHGRQTVEENDSVFRFIYYIDRDSVKNRLELERQNQANIYYEIIDKKGKTWEIHTCQKSPASPNK